MKQVHASKRNLIIGFSVSLFVLVLSSVFSYLSISKLLTSSFWVDHTNVVIQKLEAVISTMKDAETGQRGFLLTGDVSFLEPYNGASEKSLGILDSVEQLTIDNPPQTASCKELREVISDKLTMLGFLIEDKKAGRQITSLRLQEGKTYMDHARQIVDLMIDREQKLLVSRTARMDKLAQYTPFVILLASLLAVVITIVYYLRIRNDYAYREALEADLVAKDKDTERKIEVVRKMAEEIANGNYHARIKDEDLQ